MKTKIYSCPLRQNKGNKLHSNELPLLNLKVIDEL